LVADVLARSVAETGEQVLPTFPDVVDSNKSMVFSIAWHFLRDR
jgi:hypothetical protein